MRTLPYLAALIALCLSGCSRPATEHFQGYAEGEYLALAAPAGGYLATLDAPRGARIRAGGVAFTIDRDPESAAVAGADARVAAAEQRLHNLSAPRRASEIAALEANVRALEANAGYTRQELERLEALMARHLVAADTLDAARTRRDAAAANLAGARETLRTARESIGRSAELACARSDLDAARADAEQKRWLLTRKAVTAPATGEIADTYYRPGEWVSAGAAVASLLPDERRRIRFFVPEPSVSRFAPGTRIAASCDGCGTPLHARVDYLSASAEYTPPVIYSRETRARLVFRLEAAVEEADASRLRPGLPLDVVILP